MNPVSDAYTQLCDELGRDLTLILGTYFDALEAFPKVAAKIERIQNLKSPAGSKPSSGKVADGDRLTYSASEPWKRDFFYAATFGEIKQRNVRDGLNTRLVACMSIVYLYHVWDEGYRGQIASLFGIADKKLLKLDCFGDLRNLRNAIIHNHRVATREVQENRMFRWFKQGELIAPTHKHFQALSKYLHNNMLGDLQKAISAANPMVRFVKRE
jgi:hypothetical protein